MALPTQVRAVGETESCLLGSHAVLHYNYFLFHASGKRHMLGAAGIWSGGDMPEEVSQGGLTHPYTAS